MDHFAYRNGVLHAEDVSIERLIEEVGTPFYCYSTATLTRHFQVFEQAFEGFRPLICFAVKANSNIAVLRTLAALGSGADVVSEGELRRALIAGIPADRIVFSGVGKTADEMAFALAASIYQFNVESLPELLLLNEVARTFGHRAPVSFRINPDVDAGTHEKISTGKSENKFGIAWEEAEAIYARAATLSNIDVVGVDVHIGSQITALEPFEAAFAKVVELVERLRGQGHTITRVDLGGGLGVPYFDTEEAPPHPQDYARMIRNVTGDLGARLIFEPGRLIAGNAGILVSQVIFNKAGTDRKFLIVDAAMNDLLRPALYGAYHQIEPVREAAPDAGLEPMDVVGPVCETGDTFAKARALPNLQAGDALVFKTAGAYAAVMSSTYNSRPLVPEVMVNGADYAIVRERQNFAAMLGLDKLPDWLNTDPEEE